MKPTIIASSVLLGGVLSAAAQGGYTITDLGANLNPIAINNAGQIAGGREFDASQIFRYDGTMHWISPPAGSGYGALGVTSISPTGVIGGGFIRPTGQYETDAFYYDTAFHQFSVPEGASQTLVVGINAAGHMAVKANGGGVNYISTDGATLQLVEEGFSKAIYSINSSDQITGLGSGNLFFSNGTVEADIATPGNKQAVGYSISDTGYITGDFYNTLYSYADGFLYHNGVFENIPTFGGHYSYMYCVNNSGVVVGYSSSSTQRLAMSYSNGVLTDLNTQIDPSSGWFLSAAQGINDNGQIIGVGQLNGVDHGFLLTPTPEPSLVTMMVGALALFRRRRLRSN